MEGSKLLHKLILRTRNQFQLMDFMPTRKILFYRWFLTTNIKIRQKSIVLLQSAQNPKEIIIIIMKW